MRAVVSPAHPVQMVPGVTSNRVDVIVHLGGQVFCAISHVLRDFMELIVKINAVVRMVEHVMPYLEVAFVHQALQAKGVRMGVHQVGMVATVINAVLRCAHLDVAIVFLATVSACLGCLDRHVTSRVLRTAGDLTASTSATVTIKMKMDAIHRMEIASVLLVTMVTGVSCPAQMENAWIIVHAD